jgi:hypothetical protein
VEWLAVPLVVAILFGPIVYAVTFGRRGGAPKVDDEAGSTAYGEFIRDVASPPGQSGPGGAPST